MLRQVIKITMIIHNSRNEKTGYKRGADRNVSFKVKKDR